MSKKIQRLESNVINVLKSQVYTVSLSSAVREVLQNSVDAGATDIELIIDLQELRFIVHDNGEGISPDDLNSLGAMNFTSKMSKIDDLKSIPTYGFRGEALHSISNVSHLTISSKVDEYNSTWYRKLPSAAFMLTETVNADDPIFSIEPKTINSSGTTILMENLFYNLPVRKKMASEVAMHDMIRTIKEDVFQIAIFHPDVQISVSSVDQPKRIKTIIISSRNLRSSKYNSLVSAFRNIFGSAVPTNTFKRIGISFRNFKAVGIISKIATSSKNMKFIYINGRKYIDPVILKSIDTTFRNAGFGYNSAALNSPTKNVRKPYSKYPVLVLDINCTLDISDYLQDPTKNVLQPTNKQIIESLIVKVIQSFLTFQGYISKLNDTISDGKIKKNDTLEAGNQKVITLSKLSLNLIFTSKLSMANIQPKEIEGRFNTSSKYDIFKKPIFKPLKRQSHDRYNPLRDALLNKRLLPSGDSVLDIKSINDLATGNLSTNFMEFDFKVSQLTDCQIINQIDNKFLLLKLPATKWNVNPILFILDQHACDERIKLETYLKEFIISVLTRTVSNQITDYFFEINQSDQVLFNYYQKEFAYWGIRYQTYLNEDNIPLVKLTHAPDIFVNRIKGDLEYIKNALLQHIHDLKSFKKLSIENFKEFTNEQVFNDEFNWYIYSSYIPIILMELFNSKACRSAIMFGDALSKEECSILVKLLMKCYIPFQCAHGRPSILPITSFEVTNMGISMESSSHLDGCFADYELDG